MTEQQAAAGSRSATGMTATNATGDAADGTAAPPHPGLRTGFVWDEWFLFHNTGLATGSLPSGGWKEPYEHLENPDAKRRSFSLISVSGLLDRLVRIPSRQASFEELRYVHTEDYLRRIEAGSREHGGEAGINTEYGNGSCEVAARAVGSVMNCVDAVLDGEVRRAYALVRPPGHHAGADQGVGSCVFANVALGVTHALRARGLSRVAVVDMDVHHGNGTQEIFYEDPRVLTISIHQRGWYGLAGEVDERGAGAGVGSAVNVPLPSGSGRGAYLAAFAHVVVPALRRFEPELIVVSAGFDASAFDPTSSMILGSDAFRELVAVLVEAAEELCDGRIVLSHEGGYSPSATPFSVLAAVEELSGVSTGVEDPFLWFIRDSPDQQLLPHQWDCVVEAALAADLPRPASATGGPLAGAA